MHNVSYEIRNEKTGFLEKQTKSFESFKDAMTFVRSVTNNKSLIGKPLIEET